MSHHAAFSTRVRDKGIFRVSGRDEGQPATMHGRAEEQMPAKNKGYLHDSAFLADRGCLGAANLPRHPAPAHQH